MRYTLFIEKILFFTVLHTPHLLSFVSGFGQFDYNTFCAGFCQINEIDKKLLVSCHLCS